MSRYLLSTGLACMLACLCGEVRAEVNGEVSLGIVSDYRYRGLSLSGGDPALQAGFAWDHEDGWYAGLFAAGTRIGGEHGLQAVSYLGAHGGWTAGAAGKRASSTSRSSRTTSSRPSTSCRWPACRS